MRTRRCCSEREGPRRVASLLLIGVFLYLFRAVQARAGGVPSWFIYMIVAGPALYAVGLFLGAVGQVDVASDFAGGEPIRGNPGDDRADRLLEDNANAAVFALNFAGSDRNGVPVRDAASPRPPRRPAEPVHGHPGRGDRRAARASDRAARAGDHRGLLAGRARRALPGQLARWTRSGLGDGRSGALAHRRSAARSRAAARGRAGTGRVAARAAGAGEEPEPSEPEPVPERPSSRKRRRKR